VAVFEDLRDFFGRTRKDDQHRHAAVGRERIRLVGAPAILVDDQHIHADTVPQSLDDEWPPAKNADFGLREFNVRHRPTS